MKTLLWAIICGVTFLAAPAIAQDSAADMSMQILRDKIKADKKAVVAANMQLTDVEAAAFWPIYDAYQNELKAINERIGNAILDYADAYKTRTLSDATAKKLLAEAIAIDASEAKLRKDYAAKLTKALTASLAA